MEVYYNGVDTTAEKALYAREHLGGIIIWELIQDGSGRKKSFYKSWGCLRTALNQHGNGEPPYPNSMNVTHTDTAFLAANLLMAESNVTGFR